MIVLLGLHALVALAAPLLAGRLGRRVFLVVALAPGAAMVWAGLMAPGVLGGRPFVERLSWVPSLGMTADLRVDAFGLLMVALIGGVGFLIFVYSAWYFETRPGLGRFAGTLAAFAGSMLGLVAADNLLVLYVFWELTSVTSYLLIGFEDRKGSARAAALYALLVTAGGGLVMLAGFVLLGQAAGTYSLSGLLAAPPTGGAAGMGAALVLVGAFTKSAQVPFHGWLAAAMAAPTPVSAYLHSATMVKAGVYLIARLTPAFLALSFWQPVVIGVGLATMLMGGYRAIRQQDLKLLLAYGTISQLGFMVVLLGSGLPEAVWAGAAVLLAHGAFKAALFLVVGVIDHQAHTRDIRLLTGLGRRMPATFAAAALAAASMAGLPPFLGFMAKEAAFEALSQDPARYATVLAGVVAASVLTVAYSARFLWGAFATKPESPGGEAVGPEVPAPGAPFAAPALLLGMIGLALGLFPRPADRLAAEAARALGAALGEIHLALWHGPNVAVAASAFAVGLGIFLFLRRERVERLQARWAGWRESRRMPTADGTYRGSVVGLNRLADRVTGVVQSGSLPVYLGVILLTVIGLVGAGLLTGTSMPTSVVVSESPLQPVVVVLVSVTAVAAMLVDHRFAAVVLLGAVGYGVAVLFVIQGAPDLALTQLLVETLVVVIFVLALARLPARFRPLRWPLGQGLRVLVATATGALVTVLVLVSGAARRLPPVSDAYLRASLPEAGGRNVVNVILVDFRGFDTLGEITVLVVAALGIAGLVLGGRREERP